MKKVAPKIIRKKYVLGGDVSGLTPEQLMQYNAITDTKLKGDFLSSVGKAKLTTGIGTGLGAVATVANAANTNNNETLGYASSMAQGAAAGAVAGPIGMGVGAAAGALTTYLGNQSKKKAAHENVLEDARANVSGLQDNLATGGPVKGPGGPTDDLVETTLPAGSFVVPAKNAKAAAGIRKQYLGEKQSGMKAGGTVPVALSNGEHVFTPQEVAYLKTKGVGLSALAPEASDAYAKRNGGKVYVKAMPAKKKAQMPQMKAEGGLVQKLAKGDTNVSPISAEDNDFQTTRGGNIDHQKFAIDVLKELGIPATTANVTALISQYRHENSGGKYNPGGLSHNEIVDQFKTYEEGVKATADTLKNKRYTKLVTALKTEKDPAKIVNEMQGTWNTLDKNYASNTKALIPKVQKSVSIPDYSTVGKLKYDDDSSDINFAVNHRDHFKPGTASRKIIDEYIAAINESSNAQKTKPIISRLAPNLALGVKRARLNDLKKTLQNVNGAPSDRSKVATDMTDEAKRTYFDPTYQPNGSTTPKSSNPLVLTKPVDDEAVPPDNSGIADVATFKPTITDSPEDTPDQTKSVIGSRKTIQDLLDEEAGVGTITGLDLAKAKGAEATPPPPNATKNVFDKLGGWGAMAALTQTAFGVANLLSIGKRPVDTVDPMLLQRRDEAIADRNLNPAVKAAAENSIEQNKRSIVANATSAAGGDTGAGVAGAFQGQKYANDATINLAALEEQELAQKNNRADNLTGAVAASKRTIFQDKLDAFNVNQQTSGNLMFKGLDSFMTNLSYKKKLDELHAQEANATPVIGSKDLPSVPK